MTDIDGLCERLREQIADLAGESAAMTGKFEPKDWCVDVAVPNVTALLDTLERQAAEIKRLNATCYLDSFMASERKVERQAAEIEMLRGKVASWAEQIDTITWSISTSTLDGIISEMRRAALTGEDAGGKG